ncbi:MAG: hypothetical protein NVSMB21_09550 [Vulcanimicrobiaceae bacterium]
MLSDDAMESASDLQTLADSIPQMVWVTRADGYHELYNRRWYEYTGLSAAESYADGWSRVLHPDDYTRTLALWHHSLATGDPYEIEYRFRRSDGVFRWFLGSARAARDATGEIVRWYGTLTDIDERVAAERTLQFLLDASDALGGSLDLDRTLDALARVAVPRLAEWCLIYLRRDDGRIALRTAMHEDPDSLERVRESLADTFDDDLDETVRVVFATGESVLLASVARPLLDVPGAGGSDVRERDASSSAIAVPLRVGGSVIGVLHLINRASGRVATDAQRRIAEALGARASIVLDNARLFERERQIAETFQKAALPTTLPQIAGLVLDAVYEAGSAEALVGGDWYDALRLRDGRVVITVGDVAGHGLSAAVTMQAVRQALRTVTHVYADPVTILDAADRTLRTESPDCIVTAFVGIYDPVEAELRYALAGHPPPFVRRADGRIETLESPALPLGLREPSADTGHALTVAAGDLIVLYTDGVIEATRDVIEGERRLAFAIVATAADAPDAAHRIATRSLATRASDDVAILTLGVMQVGGDIVGRWTFACDDADAAHAAAETFVGLLQARRKVDAGSLYAARLVFMELVGNVVRYARGNVDIAFEDLDDPVLHVLDRGPGFVLTPHLPSDVLSERGRGLYLVWSLTSEVNVTLRSQGGAHARAVLRTH